MDWEKFEYVQIMWPFYDSEKNKFAASAWPHNFISLSENFYVKFRFWAGHLGCFALSSSFSSWWNNIWEEMEIVEVSSISLKDLFFFSIPANMGGPAEFSGYFFSICSTSHIPIFFVGIVEFDYLGAIIQSRGTRGIKFFTKFTGLGLIA